MKAVFQKPKHEVIIVPYDKPLEKKTPENNASN